jgi:hypothetical protein
MRRRLADHLGTIEDALRFRLEWLGEYEKQEREHYEPGEWEAMCDALNAALERVQGEIATSTRSQPGVERHPEYHGDTYRHFYTLANTPAIIHAIKLGWGFGADVDFGKGRVPLLNRSGDRMVWASVERVLELDNADSFLEGSIDAAIARAAQWSPA